jgi:hypothetical protein
MDAFIYALVLSPALTELLPKSGLSGAPADVAFTVGAGVNFLLGWAIQQHGSLGAPVAYTALAFILGLAIVPFATQTRGEQLPA